MWWEVQQSLWFLPNGTGNPSAAVTAGVSPDMAMCPRGGGQSCPPLLLMKVGALTTWKFASSRTERVPIVLFPPAEQGRESHGIVLQVDFLEQS